MNCNKPLIGVTTSEENSTIMWWGCALGIYLCGGKPIRLTPSNHKNYTDCDGYLIAGGVDIHPSLYGQDVDGSINMQPERDAFEKEVILYALDKKKPLFGICRGAQIINVVTGGTLYQQARNFFDGFVPTTSLLGKIFTRRPVYFTEDGILYRLCGKHKILHVNSLHHQAINIPGDHIHIVGKDGLGVVQAIERKNPDDSFIIGVQWHPEFMLYRKQQRALFHAFIAATQTH